MCMRYIYIYSKYIKKKKKTVVGPVGKWSTCLKLPEAFRIVVHHRLKGFLPDFTSQDGPRSESPKVVGS